MIMSLKSILSQLITNMLLQLKLGFAIKNKTKNKHKKIYCVFLQKEDSDNIACKTWQIKAFLHMHFLENLSQYGGEYLNQV